MKSQYELTFENIRQFKFAYYQIILLSENNETLFERSVPNRRENQI